ncbi:MAG: hypothetical protein CMO01_12565 [Thalassobius sp.]|nr:hypothetical protein [Thalassovita sp.]
MDQKTSAIPTIINIVAFTIFVAFTAYLYITNQNKWQSSSVENAHLADSLKKLTSEYQNQLEQYIANEELRTQTLKETRFDPFDSDNFRLYGLYRDVEKRYSPMEISLMFNVNNANAVKSNDVLGERWFIIPMKGVHFWEEEESLTDIASKYYEEKKDSVLISKFNLDAAPGKFIFIPFDKN